MSCRRCVELEEHIVHLEAELAGLRPKGDVLEYGSLRIEQTFGGSVYLGDAEIVLTPKPRKLLLFMAQRPNRVCTPEEILMSVWGTQHINNQNVTEQIRRVRIAIGASWIRNVKGQGYKFVPQLENS